MVATAALAAWTAGTASERLVQPLAVAGAAATGLLAVALVSRWAPLVPVAVGLVGAAYGARLAVDDPALDPAAPVVAAGLFAVAELGYRSLELRRAVADEPGAHARHAALLAVQALGALALGGLFLALVDAATLEGTWVEVAGAVAAVGMLAFVWLSARPRQG